MNNFAKYLANQIMAGKLDKEKVYELYPAEKNEIEEYLKTMNIIPTLSE